MPTPPCHTSISSVSRVRMLPNHSGSSLPPAGWGCYDVLFTGADSRLSCFSGNDSSLRIKDLFGPQSETHFVRSHLSKLRRRVVDWTLRRFS